MKHRLVRFHAFASSWRHIWSEEFVALVLVLTVFVAPVGAVTRFQERSLFMLSTVPGATTDYTISFRYNSPIIVGSVDLLFCIDPIPYHPCVTPPGLDASGATLSDQTGETGFAIDPGTHTANHIILSRSPTLPVSSGLSSYRLSGMVNPTDLSKSFSIRMRSHTSTDATGPQIDVGSIKGQVSNAIAIETQVPPMLIFCLARAVQDNCAGTDDTYYSDMGELAPDSTLTAQSQMAVGTNATAGFTIIANGTSLAAGTNVIDGLATPTASMQGVNQFGINLVANTDPAVGGDPEGTWANAVPATDYGQPNKYKYVDGDVIAFSPNVSLMKKFTVSYIVNSSPNLRAGVYTTTLTFIASGRF